MTYITVFHKFLYNPSENGEYVPSSEQYSITIRAVRVVLNTTIDVQ